eukprot:scaffold742_cov395-Prasinococcus_capsulatus_cf.AAC.18
MCERSLRGSPRYTHTSSAGRAPVSKLASTTWPLRHPSPKTLHQHGALSGGPLCAWSTVATYRLPTRSVAVAHPMQRSDPGAANAVQRPASTSTAIAIAIAIAVAASRAWRTCCCHWQRRRCRPAGSAAGRARGAGGEKCGFTQTRPLSLGPPAPTLARAGSPAKTPRKGTEGEPAREVRRGPLNPNCGPSGGPNSAPTAQNPAGRALPPGEAPGRPLRAPRPGQPTVGLVAARASAEVWAPRASAGVARGGAPGRGGAAEGRREPLFEIGGPSPAAPGAPTKQGIPLWAPSSDSLRVGVPLCARRRPRLRVSVRARRGGRRGERADASPPEGRRSSERYPDLWRLASRGYLNGLPHTPCAEACAALPRGEGLALWRLVRRADGRPKRSGTQSAESSPGYTAWMPAVRAFRTPLEPYETGLRGPKRAWHATACPICTHDDVPRHSAGCPDVTHAHAGACGDLGHLQARRHADEDEAACRATAGGGEAERDSAALNGFEKHSRGCLALRARGPVGRSPSQWRARPLGVYRPLRSPPPRRGGPDAQTVTPAGALPGEGGANVKCENLYV